ncbi:MAG: hypothetical protein WCI27_10985, partial [Candidatus Omnitrophota bacterium]
MVLAKNCGILSFGKDIKFRIRLYPKPASDLMIISEVWHERAYCPEGFNIDRDSTVIDLGAHIGAFAIFAAKQAAQGKIFAFEPYSSNYRLL